jgi:hypothetical protein
MLVRIRHCAGTRMLASGGDGISRGQVNEGVMLLGEPMAAFLPLRLTGALWCIYELNPIMGGSIFASLGTAGLD